MGHTAGSSRDRGSPFFAAVHSPAYDQGPAGDGRGQGLPEGQDGAVAQTMQKSQQNWDFPVSISANIHRRHIHAPCRSRSRYVRQARTVLRYSIDGDLADIRVIGQSLPASPDQGLTRDVGRVHIPGSNNGSWVQRRESRYRISSFGPLRSPSSLRSAQLERPRPRA